MTAKVEIPAEYLEQWSTLSGSPEWQSEMAFSSWAADLLEPFIAEDYSPRVTYPAALDSAKNVLRQGREVLPEGKVLEEQAMLEGLMTYTALTKQVGAVFRMSKPWSEING